MNAEKPVSFDQDLRLSPRPAIALFILLSGLGYFASVATNAFTRNMMLAAAAMLLGLLAFWFDLRHRKISAAMLITLATGYSLYFAWGFEIEEALIPLIVIVIFAYATLGFRSSFVATLSFSSLLLVALGFGWSTLSPSYVISLIACLWGIELFLWHWQSHINGLTRWILERYQEVTAQLEEIRASRAQVTQTTKELLEANRQLALLNERLDSARRIAEAAQQAKAAFVANVSHEFRTPLNIILGIIDVMLDDPDNLVANLPPAWRADLETIRRNSEHLSTLIGDVLDLSQVESGRISLQKERVALAEIIERGVIAVRPLMEKKNLSIGVNVPLDVPEVYCDRKRIRQVVINLLSNAARYTQSGSIRVEVKHDDRDVTVSVRDTGPGISPDDLSRLFRPFARGEQAVAEDIPGSGLGLAISKQFVDMHHGQMWADSQPSVGSTFYFRLPISPPIEPVPSASRYLVEDWVWHERAERPSIAIPAHKPRVVVCDESAELSPLMRRYFDDLEVLDTSSVAQALALIQHEVIRACVVNTTSIQTLIPLVEQVSLQAPGVPVAGYCFPPREQRVYIAGAQAFLSKPVTRTKLQTELAKLERPIQSVLVVDDNPDQLNVLRRMLLVLDPRIDVVTVSDGLQFLATLKQKAFDLVLLDIVLPGIDGWKLLELKNQDDVLRPIPVFIISGNDPDDQPRTSPYLVTAYNNGIRVEQAMRGFQAVTSFLLDVA